MLQATVPRQLVDSQQPPTSTPNSSHICHTNNRPPIMCNLWNPSPLGLYAHMRKISRDSGRATQINFSSSRGALWRPWAARGALWMGVGVWVRVRVGEERDPYRRLNRRWSWLGWRTSCEGTPSSRCQSNSSNWWRHKINIIIRWSSTNKCMDQGVFSNKWWTSNRPSITINSNNRITFSCQPWTSSSSKIRVMYTRMSCFSCRTISG